MTGPGTTPVVSTLAAKRGSDARRSITRGLSALAATLLFAGGSPAHALDLDREYGASSFKFLKLPLSPRIVALGGAGAALADGAGDLDLNPAAPASDSGRLVVGKGYPFSEFYGGSSHIIWSIPNRDYRILLNARYLGFDKINGYDELARTTTPYGAHTLKGQIGLAGRGWPGRGRQSRLQDLTWGFTANLAENSVAGANYRTAMVNVGMRYRVFEGMHAGLSVVNADFWGSEAKIEGNEDPFPPTAIQAGLAYARGLGAGFRAALAVDARTRNDEKLTWPMGLEVSWRDMIYARGGFPVAEQEPGIAAGLGLAWSMFRFQYAFQGHETLGPGHFWALEIRY